MLTRSSAHAGRGFWLTKALLTDSDVSDHVQMEPLTSAGADAVAYRSWPALRGRMTESRRSDAAREAGAWAVDVLAPILGDDWLQKTNADSVLMSPFHLTAFGELLDLALRLYLLRDVPGMAAVRKDLRRDPRVQRIVHTRMLLTLAAMAAQRGLPVAVEKGLLPGSPSVDVVIGGSRGALAAETFAVLIDASMHRQMGYIDRIDSHLMRIRSKHGVEVVGQLKAVLSDTDTDEWLKLLDEAAARVAECGDRAVVDHPVGPVTVLPMNQIATGMGFRGPVMGATDNRRLRLRVARKALQAARSGARWLHIDMMDGIWQFTQWSTWALPQKGAAIADEFRGLLFQAVDVLDGVVVSCGPAQAQGEFRGESARLDSGVVAMRRVLPAARVRETVVVPLHASGARHAMDWAALYDAEGDLLDWGLKQVGLKSADELFSTASRAS